MCKCVNVCVSVRVCVYDCMCAAYSRYRLYAETGALAHSKLGFPEHLQRLLPARYVSHEESLQIHSSFTQHTKMPCA